MNVDKIVLQFFADVLYIKEIICYEEYEAILDSSNTLDLDNITEKMLRGEYNVYKKGETYSKYAK